MMYRQGIEASADGLLDPTSVRLPPGKSFCSTVSPLRTLFGSRTFAFSRFAARIIGETRCRENRFASSKFGCTYKMFPGS